MSRLDVILVSTWHTACGVAEHAAMLSNGVYAADPSIRVLPSPQLLNPDAWYPNPDLPEDLAGASVLHLNYHAALHSRWTPTRIREYQQYGWKVLVTYHDSGVPNSEQCQAICAAADYFVLHEPFEDLPAHGEYLRMGVPGWQSGPTFAHWIEGAPRPQLRLFNSTVSLGPRPVLGTIGFPFPWKCYDELAKVTAKNGWGFLVIAPGATETDALRWHRLNPYTHAIGEFVRRDLAIGLLASCDATAFTYVCHNTGQSGAILQGIAARKPVIALSTCRQFRALFDDPLGREAILWARTFEEVAHELRTVPIQRCDPQTVALAEQESWDRVGARYAEIYRGLMDGTIGRTA